MSKAQVRTWRGKRKETRAGRSPKWPTITRRPWCSTRIVAIICSASPMMENWRSKVSNHMDHRNWPLVVLELFHRCNWCKTWRRERSSRQAQPNWKIFIKTHQAITFSCKMRLKINIKRKWWWKIQINWEIVITQLVLDSSMISLLWWKMDATRRLLRRSWTQSCPWASIIWAKTMASDIRAHCQVEVQNQ